MDKQLNLEGRGNKTWKTVIEKRGILNSRSKIYIIGGILFYKHVK